MDLRSVCAITDGIRGEVRKAVVGQDGVISLLLTSLHIDDSGFGDKNS